ncbi:hypothetical protein MMC25_003724 [Agyrium rufum]|nr:hypothetical protein [Agyrium rufum]
MADLARCLPLQRSSVQSAHDLIKPFIHETPVVTNTTLNDLASSPQTPQSLEGTPFEGRKPAKPRMKFFFKCENFQRIGAFKSRGAFHALARLTDEELQHGVVTHSSGNHAQALALAARTRGIPAYIVMPTISTPSKIAATKGYGAEVIFSGSTSEEREAVVEGVMKRTNAILVPPYDHPDIILGQGTQALELEAQVEEMVQKEPALSTHTAAEPTTNGHNGVNGKKQHDQRAGHLDAVVAPCGGGGMLSGVATAFSGTGTYVFGAEPSFEGGDDARRGLAAGKRVESVKTLTIADGLRTPLSELTWSVISDKTKVRGVYAVTEDQILKAMRLVLERMKLLVEPSAVIGLAVCLFDEDFRSMVEQEGGEGWDIGIVLSGGNTTVEAISKMYTVAEPRAERVEAKVAMDGSREIENVAG